MVYLSVMGSEPEPAAIVDEVTFEACVAVHYPRLVARLSLMVREPQEARDLAQETFSGPGVPGRHSGARVSVVGSRPSGPGSL